MKRRHLLEFHELHACPAMLRQLVTGFLEACTRLFRPYSPKLELLICAMGSTHAEQFVDLCSGNGGPWFHLAGQIEQKTGHAVSVVLTDKFPSQEAALLAGRAAGLRYARESVDARNVPARLLGVRTLFNGLHHFQPADAQAILQDAVTKGQPIAVFEMLQRNWLALLHAFFLPVSVLVLTPLVRPLTWWRLLLTYLIPVASLLLLWDGVVSVLRCYRSEELRAMTDRLGGLPYQWEAGTYWHLGTPVTYLVGYPKESAIRGSKFDVALSKDEGKTWQNVKTIADDTTGWYCYTAVEFVDDHVLLGYCASEGDMPHLALTQVTRLPVKWLCARPPRP